VDVTSETVAPSEVTTSSSDQETSDSAGFTSSSDSTPDPADSGEAAPGEPNRIVRFLGKLHPLAVHFPIALLIVAALVEAMALARCRPLFGPVANLLLSLGVAASMVAIPLGWANASTSEHIGQEATVELHRWLSIAAGSTALAAYALGHALRRKPGRSLRVSYVLVLFAAAIGVSVAGHLGGALVYGDDYLHF
jgi:uncharacterized membrane protein